MSSTFLCYPNADTSGCAENSNSSINQKTITQRLGAAKAREILFQTIANASVVSWQHINLLSEYDFSDEKLQDSVGIKPQN